MKSKAFDWFIGFLAGTLLTLYIILYRSGLI